MGNPPLAGKNHPLKMRHFSDPEYKNQHEKAAWQSGSLVCGIDEVGRGCLAGPVVTAAAILPPGKTHPLLKDSKLMTLKERLKAAIWIKKHCWYGYGIIHNRAIDRVNIYQATLLAMKKALLNALSRAPEAPSAVLVDAMPLKLLDTPYGQIPVYSFCKGETLSSSIAAASILAKVKRDTMMDRFERVFPGYALGQHKGYSTQTHQKAVRALKPSIIHRQSFLSKIVPKGDDHEGQQSIC